MRSCISLMYFLLSFVNRGTNLADSYETAISQRNAVRPRYPVTSYHINPDIYSTSALLDPTIGD